jgi:putative Ca2+/H+ antiporter (TMEM165/GDT1 family)
MSEYFTIVVVAFFAQLAVLPGEKVQLIIAALSTRYHPLGVVATAGTAFAGWTALEIWFGEALQQALPPFALDALSAAMFLLFAYLLLRSAPAPGADTAVGESATTDGGMAIVQEVTVPGTDVEVPDRFGGYLPIFVLMAAGEFGDKTQLVTISLAAQYGATSAIWAGEMLAIIPVSLVNAYFFSRFSRFFDLRKAYFVAAGLFAFFGLDTLLAMTTGVSVWGLTVERAAESLVDAL